MFQDVKSGIKKSKTMNSTTPDNAQAPIMKIENKDMNKQNEKLQNSSESTLIPQSSKSCQFVKL